MTQWKVSWWPGFLTVAHHLTRLVQQLAIPKGCFLKRCQWRIKMGESFETKILDVFLLVIFDGFYRSPPCGEYFLDVFPTAQQANLTKVTSFVLGRVSITVDGNQKSGAKTHHLFGMYKTRHEKIGAFQRIQPSRGERTPDFTLDVQNLVNHGINNYQPQLVSWSTGFFPSTTNLPLFTSIGVLRNPVKNVELGEISCHQTSQHPAISLVVVNISGEPHPLHGCLEHWGFWTVILC